VPPYDMIYEILKWVVGRKIGHFGIVKVGLMSMLYFLKDAMLQKIN
jgi:hypothetical protein